MSESHCYYTDLNLCPLHKIVYNSKLFGVVKCSRALLFVCFLLSLVCNKAEALWFAKEHKTYSYIAIFEDKSPACPAYTQTAGHRSCWLSIASPSGPAASLLECQSTDLMKANGIINHAPAAQ